MNTRWVEVERGRQRLVFRSYWWVLPVILGWFCHLHLLISVLSLSHPLNGENCNSMRHWKAGDWHGLQSLQISGIRVFFMTVEAPAVIALGCLRGSGGVACLEILLKSPAERNLLERREMTDGNTGTDASEVSQVAIFSAYITDNGNFSFSLFLTWNK